jgi:hypothetical protein
MHASAYIEFYTKGGDIELFIDDERAHALSSTLEADDWTKWIFAVDSGKHAYRWRAEGVYKYLDDIKFTYNIDEE